MKSSEPMYRGLLKVARANITAARRDLSEADEVWVNFALYNITQAVEKLIKSLCALNGIDHDYTHYMQGFADLLIEKGVHIPELVQESLNDYSRWSTQSRYTASQLVQRRFVEKHIECIDQWMTEVEKQIGI
jgi:HEPN domain-containing protein